MKAFFFLSFFVSVVTCAVLGFHTVHAATVTWNGGGSDAYWTDASNWTGGVVPGSSDVAEFNDTCVSNCSVAINASTSVLGISVSSSFRGSITQDTGSSITIGSSGFYMDGANNGVFSGGASSTSGTYYGKGKWGPFAAFFNGGNTAVATSKLLSGAQKYSLSLWFQSTTSTSSGLLIGFGDSQSGASSNYDRQIYLTSSGQLVFDNYNGSYQAVSSPSSSYNDGNWHNVVGALDNSGQYLYVDGVLVASSTNNAAKNYNGYWHIGHGNLSGVPSAPTNYYYSGLVEDARIYNRSLSASEIADLYVNSSTVNGLQDYYAFDEGTGTTAYDTAGNYTFIGSSNASDPITINGSLTVNGGSFKSTAGNLTVTNNVTLAANSFSANGGTVTATGTTPTTIDCNGSPFNVVVFHKVSGGTGTITIDAGCTVPLGTNAVSYLNHGGGWNSGSALTNYGTITVDNWTINDSQVYCSRYSGGWCDWIENYGTIHDSGTFATTQYTAWTNVQLGDIYNYGTLEVDGASWHGSGVVNENGSAVFTYGGTAMTVVADLEIESGVAPTGLTVTATNDRDTVFGCTSGQFNQVTLDKEGAGDYAIQGGGIITVLAGCTVPLGTNATSYLNGGNYWNGCEVPAITNYGTITVDNWTINDTAMGGCYQGDYINNYGTITDTGNFVTSNYNNFGVYATKNLGNIYNYGTLEVDGPTWDGSGVVQSSTATFTFGGTAMAVTDNLQLDSGTVNLPAASSTGLAVAATGSHETWLGCTPGQFNQVIFDKENGQAWYDTADIIVEADCTVPLGASSTSVFGGAYRNNFSHPPVPGLLNYGTVTVGDWTINEASHDGANWVENRGTITVSSSLAAGKFNNNNNNYDFGDFYNYGTLTVSGTSWNGSGVVNETATSTLTYLGTAMQVYGDLEVGSGTVNLPNAPSGLAVTVGGTTQPTSVGCTSSQISSLSSVNKGSIHSNAAILTVLAGCTVPLGSSATYSFAWSSNDVINYGTITGGNWTISSTGGCGPAYATNYGTIMLTGSVALTGTSCLFGDFQNYGSFTVNGSTWTGGGLINEYSTSTFAFGGNSIAVDRDFEIANDAAFSNGVSMTFQSNNNAIFAPGSYSFGGLTINKQNSTLTISSTASSITDTGNLTYYGGTLSLPNPYTLNVQGNYLQNSSGKTFASTNATVNFDGNGTSTVNVFAGTYGANLAVSKNGLYMAQLGSDLTVANGTCAVNSGTFDVNSHNFKCGGAFSVGNGGWLADYDGLESSTTITFGSGVTNNGMIFLDGSVPASCASSSPDNNILIRSTAGGTQQAWSGSGKFVMRYVNVQDQSGSTPITVWNGTNNGNNGTNWTFDGNMPVPELVQGVSGHIASAASTSLAFGYWPKPSDLIIVAVSARGQGILAPTDSAGNTYTQVTNISFTSSSQSYGLSIYYAQNVKSTSTFSVTIGGTSGGAGTLLSGAAFEYTGVDPSSTIDSFISHIDSSESATQLTSNDASAFANEIMLGASTFDNQNDVAAAGSGWTAEPGVSSNDANDQALYVEDMTPTSSVTTAATWTAVALSTSTTASTSYNDILAVFTALPGTPIHNYAASGTLDSVVFDTRDTSGAQLNTVLWQGTQPGGTQVGFQIAVSNSSSGPWNFIGPSGDGTTYFIGGPGNPISLQGSNGSYSLFTGYRYLRYRVILFSDPTGTATPAVNNIIVNWSP